MKIMLAVSVLVLFLLAPFFAAASATITDDFSTGSINPMIWDNVSIVGNCTNYVSGGALNFSGYNCTAPGAPSQFSAFIQSKQNFPANQSGYVEIDWMPKVMSSGTTFTMGLSNWSWGITPIFGGSTPPTLCGIFLFSGGGSVAISRMYPASQLIKNVIGVSSSFHTVKIKIIRLASSTQYWVYTDGALQYVENQTGGCASPPLNFTAYMSGLITAPYTSLYSENYLDNYEMGAISVTNATGAGCSVDSACDSGYCQYGFCALKPGGQSCSDDTQCISGICTNEKCAAASTWAMIEASAAENGAGDAASKNFLAMLIIFGLPVILALALRAAMNVYTAAILMTLMLGLAFFFTFVGWLNPFILLAFILGILALVVFVFMMGGSSN